MNVAGEAKPLKKPSIKPQMEKVLSYVSEHGQITEEEIRTLLGVKKTRAFIIAKQMREMDLLQVIGRGQNKRYLIN